MFEKMKCDAEKCFLGLIFVGILSVAGVGIHHGVSVWDVGVKQRALKYNLEFMTRSDRPMPYRWSVVRSIFGGKARDEIPKRRFLQECL